MVGKEEEDYLVSVLFPVSPRSSSCSRVWGGSVGFVMLKVPSFLHLVWVFRFLLCVRFGAMLVFTEESGV